MLSSATMKRDKFSWKLLNDDFLLILMDLITLMDILLWYQCFVILLSPSWWTYTCILAWFWLSLCPCRCDNQFCCYPFLYVIFDRYGWRAFNVVLWPKESGTWTTNVYNGLGTDDGFVTIVSFTWHNILCPKVRHQMCIAHGTLYDLTTGLWQ